MAFCGNCGFEVPEGMKFCPNCGTAVFDLNKTEPLTDKDSENVDSLIEDWQPVPHRMPETWDRAMVIEPDPSQKKRKKVKAKRSVPWMIIAIVSLVMGIGSWFIPSDVVTWIVLAVALAMGIVSLCKKAKFRAISIISIVVSGGLIFLWLIQGIIYLRSPHDPKEVCYGQVNITIPAKYLAKVDESNAQGSYCTKDDNAAIIIVPIDQSFSEGQFNNWSGMINNAMRESLATTFSVTGSSAAQYRDIGRLKGMTFQYTGQYEGQDVICKAIFINDDSYNNSIILANLYASKMEDKYGGDFE